MTQRSIRRAAERKANKAARKVAAQSATQTTAPPAPAEQSMAAAAAAHPSVDHNVTQETNQETHTMSQHHNTSEPETHKSATEAQINANRQNAQKSTGATTAEGKATVSQNRRTHGLIGSFAILGHESSEDLLTLKADILHEYQPQTATEWRLAQSLIEHFWRMQRALTLQDDVLDDPKKLALYMRYHTTHERAYYRALKELQKLAKERTQQQIGFERKNAQQEAHQARTRLQNARAESLEIDSHCKQVMAVPMPGMENISFQELTEACSSAIATLTLRKRTESAAAASA